MDRADETKMHPRTQRFLRELRVGPTFADTQDREIRQWRRIGAIFNVAACGVVLTLLLWAGVSTY